MVIQYGDKGPRAHCHTGLSLGTVTAGGLTIAFHQPKGGIATGNSLSVLAPRPPVRTHTALLGGGLTPPP